MSPLVFMAAITATGPMEGSFPFSGKISASPMTECITYMVEVGYFKHEAERHKDEGGFG
jgi:hypothetical protein